MSTTIMMPSTIESAIRDMCGDTMTKTVDLLAAKYGFDADEAKRFLDSDHVKIARKGAKSETKTKASAKVVDPDKPKRGPTGYLMYAASVRESVREQLAAELSEGEKLKPQAVVTAIAAKWKGLDQEVRDEWNTKAKSGSTSSEAEAAAASVSATLNAESKATKAAAKAAKAAAKADAKAEADAIARCEAEAKAAAKAKAKAEAAAAAAAAAEVRAEPTLSSEDESSDESGDESD